MKPKTVFTTGGANPYDGATTADLITLTQSGRDNFAVTYGLQVKARLTYAEAAKELGACIMHDCACDGLLDNRAKGER